MGYVLQPEEYPACLMGHNELRCIFVGGCIKGNDARFSRKTTNRPIALAHCHRSGKHVGTICVPYRSRLRSRELMLHELAHIICAANGIRKGHHKHWRRIVRELGGTCASYRLVGSTIRSKDHRSLLECIWNALVP